MASLSVMKAQQMFNEPVFFSVVLPLYNKEATVMRAIQSVLNQTVQDFEILVVNDGSTDKGPDVVAEIRDPRIRLIHQVNQGVSAARNKGIDEAKYDLIAFLDADDEWHPEFLKTTRQMLLNHPHCALYATRYFLKTPSGFQTPALVRGLSENFEGILNNYFQIAVSGAPPVWSSATCVRKNALLVIGGFPVGVKSGEDLLTWARIAARYQVAYSMKCLSIFYQTTAETYETLPSRVPEDNDVVGNELIKLLVLVQPDQNIFLRRYCAHWHKMRASCYLRLTMRKKARNELIKAIHFSISTILIIYWLLSFFPQSLIQKAFHLGSSNC